MLQVLSGIIETSNKNTRRIFPYVTMNSLFTTGLKLTSVESRVWGFGFLQTFDLLARECRIRCHTVLVSWMYSFLGPGCLVCAYPTFSWFHSPFYVDVLIDILRARFCCWWIWSHTVLQLSGVSSSFDILMWPRVQCLLWHLLGWTQYIFESPQVNSS